MEEGSLIQQFDMQICQKVYQIRHFPQKKASNLLLLPKNTFFKEEIIKITENLLNILSIVSCTNYFKISLYLKQLKIVFVKNLLVLLEILMVLYFEIVQNGFNNYFPAIKYEEKLIFESSLKKLQSEWYIKIIAIIFL